VVICACWAPPARAGGAWCGCGLRWAEAARRFLGPTTAWAFVQLASFALEWKDGDAVIVRRIIAARCLRAGRARQVVDRGRGEGCAARLEFRFRTGWGRPCAPYAVESVSVALSRFVAGGREICWSRPGTCAGRSRLVWLPPAAFACEVVCCWARCKRLGKLRCWRASAGASSACSPRWCRALG